MNEASLNGHTLDWNWYVLLYTRNLYCSPDLHRYILGWLPSHASNNVILIGLRRFTLGSCVWHDCGKDLIYCLWQELENSWKRNLYRHSEAQKGVPGTFENQMSGPHWCLTRTDHSEITRGLCRLLCFLVTLCFQMDGPGQRSWTSYSHILKRLDIVTQKTRFTCDLCAMIIGHNIFSDCSN